MPIKLACNVTEGPITLLWQVNGTSYTLGQLRSGDLHGHNISTGFNIVINVPVNNTEYVCVAFTNDFDALSNPAFIYIAGMYYVAAKCMASLPTEFCHTVYS